MVNGNKKDAVGTLELLDYNNYSKLIFKYYYASAIFCDC